MRLLIRSEARKLRATPTMWWLVLGVVGLALAGTLGAIVFDDARGLAPGSDEALRDDLHAAGAGSILVIVAGIIAMAGEFRFGQADQTFLTTPRRRDVVLVKALVLTVLGAVFGLAAALTSLLATAIWLATNDLAVPLGREVVWLTMVGAVASGAVFGALGVAIGAITRNQVPAIVACLGWLIVLEPILFQMSTEAGRWLPGGAALALRRVPEEALLPMGVGAVVLAAWTAVLLAAGVRQISRQDLA